MPIIKIIGYKGCLNIYWKGIGIMATRVVERVHDFSVEGIKQLMDNKVVKALRTTASIRMEFEKPLVDRTLNAFINKNNYRNYFVPADNIVEVFLD